MTCWPRPGAGAGLFGCTRAGSARTAGKIDLDRRALARLALGKDGTAMRFDDAMDNRHAQAPILPPHLVVKKRLKKIRLRVSLSMPVPLSWTVRRT